MLWAFGIATVNLPPQWKPGLIMELLTPPQLPPHYPPPRNEGIFLFLQCEY